MQRALTTASACQKLTGSTLAHRVAKDRRDALQIPDSRALCLSPGNTSHLPSSPFQRR